MPSLFPMKIPLGGLVSNLDSDCLLGRFSGKAGRSACKLRGIF